MIKKFIEELETNIEKVHRNFEYHAVLKLDFVEKSFKEFINLLSNKEVKFYNKYTNHKSKMEFIAGRILSKLLLLKLYKEDIYKIENYKNINITKKDNGAPLIEIDNFKSNKQLNLSISHKNNYIICAVDKKFTIGVDIEEISNRVIKVKDKYISQEEDSIIRDFCKKNNNCLQDYYTSLWSSKESIVKCFESNFMEIAKKASLKEIRNDKIVLDYLVDHKKEQNRKLKINCFNRKLDNHIFTFIKQENKAII